MLSNWVPASSWLHPKAMAVGQTHAVLRKPLHHVNGGKGRVAAPEPSRNMVSCFPKWCNHKMLLTVGWSLADKPGLSTLLLRPQDCF